MVESSLTQVTRFTVAEGDAVVLLILFFTSKRQFTFITPPEILGHGVASGTNERVKFTYEFGDSKDFLAARASLMHASVAFQLIYRFIFDVAFAAPVRAARRRAAGT